MKYKKYSSYKYTGVEWLGEVPAHWEISKLKYDSYLKARVGWHGLTADELTKDGDAFAITGSDFLGNSVDWNNCRKCTLERYNQDKFIQLNDDDLLVTKDGTIGKIIKVDKLPGLATLNGGIFVLRPLKRKYITPYYYWILVSNIFHGFISYYKTGSTISHLYQDTFNQMTYALPCIDEQQIIANFLDKATSKIDTLIEKQKRLIELLKEKRQTVISHAVTKGLDPDVKMKDSGVKWLGEIPEHWEIKPIKYIKSKNKNSFVDGPFGSNLKSEHFIDDGDVYVIESGFITTGKFLFKEFKTISKNHFLTINRSSCTAGDIIIAKIGANFGMAAELPKLDKESVVSGNSLKITLDKSVLINSLFISFLGLAKKLGGFDNIVNTSAQPALSLGGLNDMKLPVAPLQEQKAIANYLEEKTSKIDTLINKATQSIELLKEKRKALISAAVTGKIDVRNVN